MDAVELKSITCVDGTKSFPGNNDVIDATDSNYGSLDDVPGPKEKENNIVCENAALENGIRQRKNIYENTETDKKDLSSDEDEEDDDDGLYNSRFSQGVKRIQDSFYNFFREEKAVLRTALYIILVVLYFAYFGYAMYYRFGDEGSVRLLVFTVLACIVICVKLILRFLGAKAECICCTESLNTETGSKWSNWIYRGLQVAIVVFAIIYIIVAVAIPSPRNLISLAGIIFFIVVFFIFSYNPARVNWRPVFWGLAIQFIFALLILRWEGGYQVFKWLGDRVTEYLAYTDAGSKFVFGEEYTHHFFAFKVLTTVVFFSTTISVLYYLEIMQFVIRNIAKFMAMAMGTSATESLNAAGNIFIGQSESPLMIRPFLKDMTKSELHAVCTGGFATIAGSVMAAYILYDVPANHLLSASVMSAPAALAMSKLFYPETKKSKAKDEDVYKMEKGKERNIIEAASAGATQSVKLVANIAVNLIAFIAMLEFVNATLSWFGERVGLQEPEYERLTFQLICSYVFWPVAFLMGVETEDCRKVAEMIGIKTFINEFVAYTELSVYIRNKQNLTWYEGLANSTNSTNVSGIEYTGTWYYEKGDIKYNDLNITLVGGLLKDRSVVIATYALCGFSNIASIGVMLGALGTMAPSRKSDVSQVVIRAMIAGNVACFMTACIAGLLYSEKLK